MIAGAPPAPPYEAAVRAATPVLVPPVPAAVGRAPLCAKRGCVMQPSDVTSASRSHYFCDRCSGRSAAQHLGGSTRRWTCVRCDYDICFKCHPEPGATGA
ncbi:unnamed protein product [Prorocentrum cordatum]|uniref:ZZ-type domain-containing protein n=1 Tax=Prorocentrum cordatum TaxID=2364126 RepID=A0ABN9T1K8_9DINO|nr:unnamed protein product [Polarella glacialis]